MALLTIGGWLAVIVLAALTVLTAGQRSYPSATAALGLGCVLACTLGFLGALPGVAAVGIAVALALITVAMVAETPRNEHGKRDYAKALRDAWGCVPRAVRSGRGGVAAAGRWRRHGPPDELAPRRDARRAADAPAPALPAADGPAAGAPRLVPAAAAGIPGDHAAAHQRIASFEPEGLSAHVHFLLGEGKALAGYTDAFGTYADGLIHGPGVPPEATKAIFDFADMFADVSQMAHLANKKLLDYFQGHLEWAENHEPTRDGHWTVRE